MVKFNDLGEVVITWRIKEVVEKYAEEYNVK